MYETVKVLYVNLDKVSHKPLNLLLMLSLYWFAKMIRRNTYIVRIQSQLRLLYTVRIMLHAGRPFPSNAAIESQLAKNAPLCLFVECKCHRRDGVDHET